MVLVHGLVGTMHGGANGLAVDLLGYGPFRELAADGMVAQAEHLRAQMDAAGIGSAHVVGHSMGGVVTTFFADRYPERVLSLTSIEGNFTLDDAFMAGKLAVLSEAEVSERLAVWRSDVGAWLREKGIRDGAAERAMATAWLGNQEGATLWRQARAIMTETQGAGWEAMLGRVFGPGRRFHLVAGERSRAGWHVPEWVRERAASWTVIPGAGHFPMIEDPAGFGRLLGEITGAI